MKQCSKCKINKPLEAFSKCSKNPDGLNYICKSCVSFYDQQRERPRQREQKRAIIERNRRFVFEYLEEHPCECCGESDPVVLEFDHCRGKKHKNISKMIRDGSSLEKIKEEIDKCQVLCANCHRRKTAIQFEWAITTYTKQDMWNYEHD